MTDKQDTTTLRLGIIVGSIRPGRRAIEVADWVARAASARDDLHVTLIDIGAYGLGLLDEPMPAITGQYEQEATKSWAAEIASQDAFVVVTPEYNRSIPGPLKNAIDHLYWEWADKAAGFVSYGSDAAGGRAVEHLRTVAAELRLADVRAHVTLPLADAWTAPGDFSPTPRGEQELSEVLTQVTVWGRALRAVRAARDRTAA